MLDSLESPASIDEVNFPRFLRNGRNGAAHVQNSSNRGEAKERSCVDGTKATRFLFVAVRVDCKVINVGVR